MISYYIIANYLLYFSQSIKFQNDFIQKPEKRNTHKNIYVKYFPTFYISTMRLLYNDNANKNY